MRSPGRSTIMRDWRTRRVVKVHFIQLWSETRFQLSIRYRFRLKLCRSPARSQRDRFSSCALTGNAYPANPNKPYNSTTGRAINGDGSRNPNETFANRIGPAQQRWIERTVARPYRVCVKNVEERSLCAFSSRSADTNSRISGYRQNSSSSSSSSSSCRQSTGCSRGDCAGLPAERISSSSKRRRSSSSVCC